MLVERKYRNITLMIAAVIAAWVVLFGVIGVRIDNDRTFVETSEELQQLSDISQLRVKFNEDSGAPRIILFLSPT